MLAGGRGSELVREGAGIVAEMHHYRSHAPRGNAFRDALRHTAVLRCQLDRCKAQVPFSPLGD